MDSGNNEVTFTAIGKNQSSSGYWIGLDTILATPSEAREAEAYLPPDSYAGPAPTSMYMAAGSWSANHQLLFPSTTTGQEFTVVVYNDQWTETNFRRTGYSADNTTVEFDHTLDPSDYVVTAIGNDYGWWASEQTGTSGEALTNDVLSGYAVRVLLKGTDMDNGGWIKHDGGKVLVLFQAGGQSMGVGGLNIIAACIAEAASSTTPTLDYTDASVQLTFNDGDAGVTIPARSAAWSDPANVEIDRDKSYLVSFLVDTTALKGRPWYWEDSRTNEMSCGVVSNAVLGDLIAQWDGRGDVSRLNGIPAVRAILARYPTNVTYTSGPFDTQLADPMYSSIDWNATVPANGAVRFKVRTATDSSMSDAAAWSNITAIAEPGPIFGVLPRRYVQWQVQLVPNQGEADPDNDLTISPALQDVTIAWPGEQRLCSIGGVFTKGLNYGVYRVAVNGDPLVAGVIVDLEIFADVRGYGQERRITSRLMTEIHPRNTAK